MRWAPLLLACAVAAASAGQEAPRPAAVRIDAIVTNRAGQPLRNLTASDFELRWGGVVQAIQALELRNATAPDAPGRVFALFLDEFHVSPGPNTELVRSAALQFMDAHVRPADQVVVMKPLDSQLEIALTHDRSTWRRAIETFEGRGGDFAPRTAFEEQYLGRAPAIVEASRAQIVTSALRALVTRLGESSPTRSAVAFVSEGFAPGGRTDRERRLPDFQSIVRVASRAGVAVYTLNPSASSTKDGGDVGITLRLEGLAADTGGEMSTGADLAATLARMSRDLDTYYVLTFTPSQAGEGRYQRVELTSKRRDAVVRARSGYWTPVSPVAIARSESTRLMRPARKSPLIQSWYGLSRLSDGRMRLRVTWEPSPRRPASRREPAAVAVRAARAGGDALLEHTVAAAQLAEVIVPPGRLEIDLSVMAADGTEIDRETRDIDVPDANAPRGAALAPEIIRARTLREFRSATVNPAAAPTPSREFRRSDRLIVRATTAPTATPLDVSARLLNRWGQPMRDLEVLDPPDAGTVQFSLPLAWLVPGEYEVELRTTQAGRVASQKIPVRVIG